MFRKILIANRGEIALRIIRACRELGIRTVAVYSEADKDSLHVRFADEHICIGPANAAKSYLNMHAIIAAAEVTNAEAIHPGYGFLAENADFAEVLERCEIVFIGPPAAAIRRMGNKVVARETAARMGVPIVRGSNGSVAGIEQAQTTARALGYPVMLKSAAGGGGRGIRVAFDEEELLRIFPMAQAEAEAAFGDGDVYLEQYLDHPRHVEVQVLADRYGNVIHLGERECSLQRRRQKMIEESPCPGLDAKTRHALGVAAIACARGCDYVGAGTVEFLIAPNGKFSFMEMNTRVQVEHPVTELVTGVDIVKEQIRIAAGEKLSWRQQDIELRGAAIECRITAEDPEANFAPRPGTITALHLPGGPGVRIDTHIYSEYQIPPHYDSLLAKVITYGANREEALCRMRRALAELVIEGTPTVTPFLLELLGTEAFRAGKTNTWFVDEYLATRNGSVATV